MDEVLSIGVDVGGTNVVVPGVSAAADGAPIGAKELVLPMLAPDREDIQ